MLFKTYFTNSGSPATGLSPTIRIREAASNTLVVSDAAMTEIGEGFYKYDFTAFDSTKDYVVRCDGGAGLTANERYSWGTHDFTDETTLQATRDNNQFQTISSTSVQFYDPATDITLAIQYTKDNAFVAGADVRAGIYRRDTGAFVEEIILNYKYSTNSYIGTWASPYTPEVEYAVVLREKDASGPHYAPLFEGFLDSGGDSITASALTDVEQSWATDEWAGKYLFYEGQELLINSNTGSVLNFSGNTVFDLDKPYFIYDYKARILDTLIIRLESLDDADVRIS